MPDENKKSRDDITNKIMERLDKISDHIHGITMAEYHEMIKSPHRMILVNFVAGLARGLGIAVGATFLGGIFLVVLFRVGQLNLPLIGEFIARVIKIVQTYL